MFILEIFLYKLKNWEKTNCFAINNNIFDLSYVGNDVRSFWNFGISNIIQGIRVKRLKIEVRILKVVYSSINLNGIQLEISFELQCTMVSACESRRRMKELAYRNEGWKWIPGIFYFTRDPPGTVAEAAAATSRRVATLILVTMPKVLWTQLCLFCFSRSIKD